MPSSLQILVPRPEPFMLVTVAGVIWRVTYEWDDGVLWRFDVAAGQETKRIYRDKKFAGTGPTVDDAPREVLEQLDAALQPSYWRIGATGQSILNAMADYLVDESTISGSRLRKSLGLEREVTEAAFRTLVPRYVARQADGYPRDFYRIRLPGVIQSHRHEEFTKFVEQTLDFLATQFDKDPDLEAFHWGDLRAAVSVQDEKLARHYLEIARLVAPLPNPFTGSHGALLAIGSGGWLVPEDIEELAKLRTMRDFLEHIRKGDRSDISPSAPVIEKQSAEAPATALGEDTPVRVPSLRLAPELTDPQQQLLGQLAADQLETFGGIEGNDLRLLGIDVQSVATTLPSGLVTVGGRSAPAESYMLTLRGWMATRYAEQVSEAVERVLAYMQRTLRDHRRKDSFTWAEIKEGTGAEQDEYGIYCNAINAARLWMSSYTVGKGSGEYKLTISRPPHEELMDMMSWRTVEDVMMHREELDRRRLAATHASYDNRRADIVHGNTTFEAMTVNVPTSAGPSQGWGARDARPASESPAQPPRVDDLVERTRASEGSVDVVIITAAEDEDTALLEVSEGALSPWTKIASPVGYARDVYRAAFESLTASGRPIHVVTARPPRMGGDHAGVAAGQLLGAFKPRCIAICGVCAGRPDWTALGDVIIADRVWRYDTGERLNATTGGRPTFKKDNELFALSPTWLRAAENAKRWTTWPGDRKAWLEARPRPLDLQGLWLMKQLAEGLDPADHPDVGTMCSHWADVTAQLKKDGLVMGGTLTDKGREHLTDVLFEHQKRLPEPRPWAVHVAPMGTGNHLVRDVDIWASLEDEQRLVCGFDMEASIIGMAAWAAEISFLAVKGVMDFGLPDRHRGFRPFAARASAEVLVRLLRTLV